MHALIALDFLLPHSLKTRMRLQMLDHPAMQILHIRDGVDFPARPEHVCVLGIQRRADDSGFVFPRFEVRVGEAEEDFFELGGGEEVGEEFHCVGAEGGDVLVGVC